jgi:hypothetical protein
VNKDYCTQNDGDCDTCSLVSYGRDCRNLDYGHPRFSGLIPESKGWDSDGRPAYEWAASGTVYFAGSTVTDPAKLAEAEVAYGLAFGGVTAGKGKERDDGKNRIGM